MTTLTAFRVPPQQEHKVAAELREAGIKAYVPRNRSRKRNPFTKKHPTESPGYVFAVREYTAAFRRHAMNKLGKTSTDGIASLYVDRMKPASARPFIVGDLIEFTAGARLGQRDRIVALRGRGTSKTVLVGDGRMSVNIRNIKHYDPG